MVTIDIVYIILLFVEILETPQIIFNFHNLRYDFEKSDIFADARETSSDDLRDRFQEQATDDIADSGLAVGQDDDFFDFEDKDCQQKNKFEALERMIDLGFQKMREGDASADLDSIIPS